MCPDFLPGEWGSGQETLCSAVVRADGVSASHSPRSTEEGLLRTHRSLGLPINFDAEDNPIQLQL
jgi:hypothetical protein